MHILPNRSHWSVRALLEEAGAPFGIASYERQAPIFLQGDPCDDVMHLEKGQVRLAVTAPSGKEVICGVVDTGAFMGEEALTGQAVRRHSATALTATIVLVVPKAKMVRLLHTQPAIADRFIAYELARNGRLQSALTDQLLHPSEQRLAHTLLMLAGCDETHPCRCALPRVSQEVLAEMVGTTRPRVCLFMGKFKTLGCIEEHRGALYVTPSLLQVLHDDYRGALTGIPPTVPDHCG